MWDVVSVDQASQSSESESLGTAGYRVSFPTSTAILLTLAIGAQTLYYGLPPTDLILITVLLGLMKACGWCLMAKAVCIVPRLSKDVVLTIHHHRPERRHGAPDQQLSHAGPSFLPV